MWLKCNPAKNGSPIYKFNYKIMKTKIINAKKFFNRSELKKVAGGSSSRCRNGGSCTINISGQGNQPGVCETNSNNQCICRALNVSGSAPSTECLR